MGRRNKLDNVIQMAIGRVLQVVKAKKIILFGSSASRWRHADSDIDLLVVVKGPVQHLKIAGKIHSNLHGIPIPVDVVVATEDELNTYRASIGTVIYSALRKGTTVYEA